MNVIASNYRKLQVKTNNKIHLQQHRSQYPDSKKESNGNVII